MKKSYIIAGVLVLLGVLSGSSSIFKSLSIIACYIFAYSYSPMINDIKLNWCRWVIYVLGWIQCLFPLSGFIVWWIFATKDEGKTKHVKGKITRNFEKFIYVAGWIALVGTALGLLLYLLFVIALNFFPSLLP